MKLAVQVRPTRFMPPTEHPRGFPRPGHGTVATGAGQGRRARALDAPPKLTGSQRRLLRWREGGPSVHWLVLPGSLYRNRAGSGMLQAPKAAFNKVLGRVAFNENHWTWPISQAAFLIVGKSILVSGGHV